MSDPSPPRSHINRYLHPLYRVCSLAAWSRTPGWSSLPFLPVSFPSLPLVKSHLPLLECQRLLHALHSKLPSSKLPFSRSFYLIAFTSVSTSITFTSVSTPTLSASFSPPFRPTAPFHNKDKAMPPDTAMFDVYDRLLDKRRRLLKECARAKTEYNLAVQAAKDLYNSAVRAVKTVEDEVESFKKVRRSCSSLCSLLTLCSRTSYSLLRQG